MKSAGEMLVLKTNTQIQLYVCIKYGKVWCLLPGPFCQSQTLKLGEVWAGAVAAVGNRATCCAFYLTFGSVDLWIAYMRSCLKASNWCNPIRGTTSLPNTIEVTKDLLYSTASWLKWRKVKKLFIYFFLEILEEMVEFGGKQKNSELLLKIFIEYHFVEQKVSKESWIFWNTWIVYYV